MNKLELKHIAPYLPYNLDILHNGVKKNLIVADNETCEYWISLSGIKRLQVNSKNDIKPILRPLSDITKNIEHNGEKFYPIGKLHYKSYRTYGSRGYAEYVVNEIRTATSHYLTTKKDAFSNRRGIDINLWNMSKNEYWINRQLFEWHFDVFGLIGKGLAIDINTLKD